MQRQSKAKPAETYSSLSVDFGGMPGTLLPETNWCYAEKSQGFNFKGLHTQLTRLYLHDKLNSISKV